MDSFKVIANPIETEGGPSVELWRILVNGQEVTSHATPFSASKAKVVLHECLTCFHCGSPDLSVRKSGNLVIWFGDDPNQRGTTPGLPRGTVFVFDAAEYQAQVGKGRATDLPTLTGSEIGRILAAHKATDWHLGLYTDPDLPGDLSGQMLLHLLAGLVETPDDAIHPVDAPLSSQRVTIGLDLPGVPECVLDVGHIDLKPIVRLVSLPSFPLWLSGSRPVERLCQHVFQELARRS